MFLGIGAHSRHAEFLCLTECFRQKNIRTYSCHADGADTRRFFWLTQNARNAQNYIWTEEHKDIFLSRRRCGHTQNLFGSHRMHGIHRIIFRQKNIRTYSCHADGADTRRFFRQKNRRTDLYLTQRRRGREAICSFVLLSKTAEEGTSRASKILYVPCILCETK